MIHSLFPCNKKVCIHASKTRSHRVDTNNTSLANGSNLQRPLLQTKRQKILLQTKKNVTKKYTTKLAKKHNPCRKTAVTNVTKKMLSYISHSKRLASKKNLPLTSGKNSRLIQRPYTKTAQRECNTVTQNHCTHYSQQTLHIPVQHTESENVQACRT